MLNNQSFKEVTKVAGDFSGGRSYGAGSWADFNGDGYPDLWTGGHFGPSEKLYNRNLYLNKRDGTFEDIVADVFLVEELEGDFHGSAWADFDNDGDQDLVVLSGGENAGTNHPPDSSPNRLYINDRGLLRDSARELDLAYDSAKAQIPIWLDFNNDGWLDLFHGSTQRPDQRNPTTIFQQKYNGFKDVGAIVLPERFQETTVKLGILATSSSENSGLDLVLLGGTRTILDTTTAVSFSEQLSPLLRNATDVAVADFNGDLQMDIYATTNKEDRLAINKEQGLLDVSLESGINDVLNVGAVSVVSADFDNDMDVDIYVVRARDETSNAPNVLYENQGDGTFLPVVNAGGAVNISSGDGDAATIADYNLDGFVDLFVTNGARASYGRQQLFQNQGNNNNWLQIDLEGVNSNRDGIGAQVYVTTGETTQRRDQMGGVHRWSQNHQRLHFGLAQNTQADRIEIRWPSGIIQQLTNVPVNQILQIVEDTNIKDVLPGTRYGTDWDDMLIGGKGKDILFGQAGSDFLAGGNGRDFLFGGDDSDILNGEVGNDTLFGEQGFDNLYGGHGKDFLNGGGGRDFLFGGDGNDILIGEDGKDMLEGGKGQDTLTGGNDEDTFVLALGNGADIIIDFSTQDLIGLAGGLGIGELSFAGNEIMVSDTKEVLATLIGVNAASLNTSQFVLI